MISHPHPELACITEADLEKVKLMAVEAPLGRARILLHRSHKDPIQEMIVAINRGTYIPPHRHGDRSESLHIIEGRIRAIFFDDNGNLVETLDLGDKGEPLIYRLAWDRWHTVIALSTQAVFHETVCGPFEAGRVLLAPWAPRQDSVEQGQRFVTWLEGQTK